MKKREPDAEATVASMLWLAQGYLGRPIAL
jgi:hypothetical protein